MTVDQILADNRKMEQFICDRLRTDRTRIVLADGRPPDGPAWVDLALFLCDDGDHELVIESNEPDAFGVREVYEHFRRLERTSWEREREIQGEMNRWKVLGLEGKMAMLRDGVEAEMLVRLERIEDKLDGVAEKSKPAPDYSSIKQAARITGLSDSHIRRAVVSGELPASNIGSSASHPIYRIALKDLHDWMNNKKGGNRVPPKSKLKELIHRHLPGL
jgi:excisionase family DNA binding protein